MFEEGAFAAIDRRIMMFKTLGIPKKVLLKQPISVDKETLRLEQRLVEVITNKIKPLM